MLGLDIYPGWPESWWAGAKNNGHGTLGGPRGSVLGLKILAWLLGNVLCQPLLVLGLQGRILAHYIKFAWYIHCQPTNHPPNHQLKIMVNWFYNMVSNHSKSPRFRHHRWQSLYNAHFWVLPNRLMSESRALENRTHYGPP